MDFNAVKDDGWQCHNRTESQGHEPEEKSNCMFPWVLLKPQRESV